MVNLQKTVSWLLKYERLSQTWGGQFACRSCGGPTIMDTPSSQCHQLMGQTCLPCASTSSQKETCCGRQYIPRPCLACEPFQYHSRLGRDRPPRIPAPMTPTLGVSLPLLCLLHVCKASVAPPLLALVPVVILSVPLRARFPPPHFSTSLIPLEPPLTPFPRHLSLMPISTLPPLGTRQFSLTCLFLPPSQAKVRDILFDSADKMPSAERRLVCIPLGHCLNQN